MHDIFLGSLLNAQLPCLSSLAHYNDSIAHTQNLCELGRNHNNGFPLFYQIVHQRIDLTLGAYVNTSRRLIKDQNVTVSGQPFCNNNLLLITTG